MNSQTIDNTLNWEILKQIETNTPLQVIQTFQFCLKLAQPPDDILQNLKQGFSYCLCGNIAHSVYLYNKDKLFKPFKSNYRLPYNLNLDYNGEQIVSIFGEPSEKGGGGINRIYLVYKQLGLEIVFDSYSWEMNNAKINYIVFFQNEQEKLKCSLCKKESIIQCDCKIVNYCSENCKNEFKKVHQKYCEKMNN